ncbi:Trp biosynthesis-associated membrane protein [Pimelobacter simplex]|uniref:Trp biosynthesis-associated membrane protein n=1 Tax=Nocardioides simplex TaxID=2045 RepID=UPI003AAEC864
MAESRARRAFGPVVLLGLVGSGAAAIGGHKEMLTIPEATLRAAGGIAPSVADRSVEFPLAGALALVALACWGVLLVTRGWVRRVVAALGLVAAAGVFAVVVVGGFVQDDQASTDLAARLGLDGSAVDAGRTTWLWVALLGALVALVAAGLAVRLVPSWPEMGSRYDAPTSGAATTAAGKEPEEQSNLDLWKSLDEGGDPTAD